MKQTVLYDGACGICDASVRYIWQHDPEGLFQFAPLQSELATDLLAQHGLAQPRMDTIYLLRAEGVFCRSEAALRILGQLHSPWRWLVVLLALPRVLRDPFYRLIAKNRHRLLPKAAACELPPPNIRERFLA